MSGNRYYETRKEKRGQKSFHNRSRRDNHTKSKDSNDRYEDILAIQSYNQLSNREFVPLHLWCRNDSIVLAGENDISSALNDFDP